MGSIHSCLMLLSTEYTWLVSRPLTEFLEHGLVLDLDVRYHDTWAVLILQDTMVGAVFSRRQGSTPVDCIHSAKKKKRS